MLILIKHHNRERAPKRLVVGDAQDPFISDAGDGVLVVDVRCIKNIHKRTAHLVLHVGVAFLFNNSEQRKSPN